MYHGAAMVLEHHGLLSLEMIVPIKLHPRSAEGTCSRNPLGRWLSARGSEEGTELAEEDLLELAVCVCPGHSGHSRCPVSFSLAQRAARAVCMRDTPPPLAAVLVLTETSGLSVCVLDIG